MHDIKFRAYDSIQEVMVYNVDVYSGPKLDDCWWAGNHVDERGNTISFFRDGHLMQYAGFQDANKKDVYEGDIRREEIEFDEGDERYYYVLVYIREWCMFAWVCATDGEYSKYLKEGAVSLDTTSFWTYPAGDKGEVVTVCGNIYENPKLLEE
jgi:uncharacterized phage protein (TIGR01671 family)